MRFKASKTRRGMKCRTAAGRRHLMSGSTLVEWKTCELEDENARRLPTLGFSALTQAHVHIGTHLNYWGLMGT